MINNELKLYEEFLLLAASNSTNFIYKVTEQLTSEQTAAINDISSRRKVKDRLHAIYHAGAKLQFTSTEKAVFGNNLLLIDSLLPRILSELALRFYQGKASTVLDLVNLLEEENPLGFDQSSKHTFYTYKIKRLLSDIALGMMPSEVWTGQYDATGGCLVVKEDGEIVCYHIYHKNEFENYLLNNTKLETASSSRHSFGKVYNENGESFMNLNLQIRFIK